MYHTVLHSASPLRGERVGSKWSSGGTPRPKRNACSVAVKERREVCEPTAVCELLNLVPLVKIVIASQSSRQGTLAKNPLRSWCFGKRFAFLRYL